MLAYLSQGDLRSRAEILGRFARDDQDLVRSMLHDLTESGLALSSGSEPDQVYRATTHAEKMQIGRMAEPGAYKQRDA